METPYEEEESRIIPVFPLILAALYFVTPFIMMLLRPGYAAVYEQMGMADKLPLPTKLILWTPMPLVFLVVLAIDGLLVWAAFKGPRRLVGRLNVAGIVGLGCGILMWYLGVTLPILKIQEQLQGRWPTDLLFRA